MLSSGHDESNKSWHSQLKKTYPTCSSPRAIPAPLPKDCSALEVSLPHSAPVTAAQREPGPHSRQNPGATLSLGKERCRGLKGTKFINLERHKSSQSSAPATMSPGSTGEDLGMLLQPWPAASNRTGSSQNPLGTPSWALISDGSSTPKAWIFWRTVFCISVGEFGLILVLVWDVWGFFWFCLVWVCLGFFTIFTQTALMAVYNSRLGMLVLLSKSLVMTDIANSASPGQCWQTAGLSQQFWQ